MASKQYEFFKQKPITLPYQDLQIKTNYPNFQLKNYRNIYIWEGPLQPTPLSDIYTVRIEYDLKHSPKIYVLSPKLRVRDGEIRIPHIYSQNRLCVFLPRTDEWTNQKFISETIIPWISLWLLYYESWLATGEWLGGGIHPPIGEDKTDD